MSTTTTNLALVKPELTDPANITAFNENWDKIDDAIAGGRPVKATSTDGVYYYATVPGVTGMYTGLELTIIPDMTSTSRQPYLMVNGLIACRIVMPINGSNTSATTQPPVLSEDDIPTASKWLSANKPVKVRFDGSYWETDIHAQSASNLYGQVPIASGGTGANTAAGARKNLGILTNVPTVANTMSEAGYYYLDVKVSRTISVGGSNNEYSAHLFTGMYYRESGAYPDLFEVAPPSRAMGVSGEIFTIYINTEGGISVTSTEDDKMDGYTYSTTINLAKLV